MGYVVLNLNFLSCVIAVFSRINLEIKISYYFVTDTPFYLKQDFETAKDAIIANRGNIVGIGEVRSFVTV